MKLGKREGNGGRDNRVNKTGVTPCSPNTAGVGTRAPGDRAEVRLGKGKAAKSPKEQMQDRAAPAKGTDVSL